MSTGSVFLHFGPMPIETMAKASKMLGKNAVIDTNVARMAGASFAAGTPEAIEALRKKLTADSLRSVENAYPNLTTNAKEWLANGAQGQSSLALFCHLANIPSPAKNAHPWDLDDFGRCKRMIEQVPEFKEKLPLAATLSPTWANIVKVWDALCAAMDDPTAKSTKYAAANALLKGALKNV